MAERAGFGFLYRSQDGTIGAADWRRGAAWLAVAAAGLVLLYAALDVGLGVQMVGVATLFTLGFMFLCVCYHFLTVKRARAIGAPTALGFAVPVAAFALAFAHWVGPNWLVLAPRLGDLAFAAAAGHAIWTFGR
ncbi:MAG: hypothetical protein KGI57_06795 [Hyphomicrobiales bacterium]|nr:hypothetical protein [Hyphomicrobiales bacterium]MDE2017394.1 hypothetical protein [Hyphomicrobiales bacterium]